MLREDKCFADNGKECSALKFKQCRNCAFYKTLAQVEEERDRYMDKEITFRRRKREAA